MNKDLRRQIHSRMNVKDTEELLDIWQTNDRFEWSDDTFDVVRGVLQERGVDIPEQNEPIYEHGRQKSDSDIFGFSKEELKIIDDANPPAFYDPFDVLTLTKRLELIIKVMVGFVIFYGMLNYPESRSIIRGFFVQNPNPMLEVVISVMMVIANTVINVALTYIPLKALTKILRILMEMEFRSRKAPREMTNP